MQRAETVGELISCVVRSDEYQNTARRNHVSFNGTLDSLEVLSRYEDKNRRGRPGFITDFVGSFTDSRYWPHLTTDDAIIEGLPIPRSFHADAAEWTAAFRSLDLAADRFTAIELGAGWAPWLVSCGVAARALGMRVRLTAIEADPKHIRKIRKHFADNDFGPDDVRVIEAVAGPTSGVAAFPVSVEGSDDWGIQPVFCANESDADALTADGPFVDYRGLAFNRVAKVRSVSLREVVPTDSVVDLMHIDIQGGEAELIDAHVDLLSHSVRYLVIGTHSREIEGRLISSLGRAGWRLELEKPCVFSVNDRTLNVTIDGTQGWRNPALV